ncbi:shikimate kinase [candidate division KSB1 bacterium]|nr:shikimate kinase [candidate division KSB1 bacterium]
MQLQTHIFLIGFMGCGKTTIGKDLAVKFNVQFIDTDVIISEKTNLSIPDIFEKWGESKFREIETQVIGSIVALPPSIISLGGGAILSEQNRSVIFNSGLSIYLKWRVKTLFKRLADCDSRPLLSNIPQSKLLEQIMSMMNERSKYYERAHIVIPGDRYKNINLLIEHIIHEISTYKIPTIR